MPMKPKTGSELFAIARGVELCRGQNICFYCGAECGQTFPAADYVKKTCTIRQYVVAPGSDYVCAGCAESKQEKTTIPVYDEVNPREKTKIRLFSWVITEDKAIAATKAHAAWLQSVCIDPPEPPYAIALSESGQRHVVYWTSINRRRDVVTLNLELDKITYKVDELRKAVQITEMLIAASGKTRLQDAPSTALAMQIYNYWGELSLHEQWMQMFGKPLSRLAVFLSRKKEVCKNEYKGVEASK